MPDDKRFAQLVSLACHDLRTPLATVFGFARTELEPPTDRYVEMIDAASTQLGELLDELSLLARIQSGRYEPRLVTVDSLELAREAAAELEDGRAEVSGKGGPVRLGEELRDLGAAAATELVRALGGSVDVVDERLVVRLPA